MSSPIKKANPLFFISRYVLDISIITVRENIYPHCLIMGLPVVHLFPADVLINSISPHGLQAINMERNSLTTVFTVLSDGMEAG